MLLGYKDFHDGGKLFGEMDYKDTRKLAMGQVGTDYKEKALEQRYQLRGVREGARKRSLPEAMLSRRWREMRTSNGTC